MKPGEQAGHVGSPARGFRWVKPAASLKRLRNRIAVQHLDMFPLGKTGGLIEATAGPRHRAQQRRRFRWVKPAASLKHVGDGQLQGLVLADVSAG